MIEIHDHHDLPIPPNSDDADLTPWEQLQVTAMTQILRTGTLHFATKDLDVVLEYPTD